MTGHPVQTDLARLEDFIALSKRGSEISASLDLQKQYVSQKGCPGNSEEMASEADMYLLLARFAFKTGSGERKVSKVYVFGSAGESEEEARINTNIANARLREDCKRLAAANISVREKLF